MNQSDIQSAIDLHQKAFALLLSARDSGHAASRPFDEKTVAAWRHTDSCVDWIHRHYEELPSAFRPEREDIRAFSQFLVSFFATSFSVSQARREGGVRLLVRALPSRRLDGSRKSKHAKDKERKVADALRRMALTALAAELTEALDEEQISKVLSDDALAADLTLWTYAQQLVNRSQYASQGPAVYTLWLDLPEKTRRGLNADLVWQSRARLVQSLTSIAPIS